MSFRIRSIRTPGALSTQNRLNSRGLKTPPVTRNLHPYPAQQHIKKQPSEPAKLTLQDHSSTSSSRPLSARPSSGRLILRNTPITPSDAIAKYSPHLNSYELKEIAEFPEVYFLGSLSKKIKPLSKAPNHGYDLSTHHYKVNPGDHIAYRYEVKGVIGKGAFGQVIRCYDHKLKMQVAIKIIINTPQMETQGKREVEMLKYLNDANGADKSCIIQVMDSFTFRNHVCVVFEVLGQNLYEFSRSNYFKPLNSRQLRAIAKQILTAIAFTHAHNIVHCDIKPENAVLLPLSTQSLRLIDYGSACYVGQKHFDYIQSRFYRAPEVILGLKYGPPMDIWSFACIIAELMGGKPLFGGDSEANQIELQMNILGPIPKEMLMKAPRTHIFFDSNLKQITNGIKRKKIGGSSISKVSQIKDPLLLDLLEKCLRWDPNARITAQQALTHPYFAKRSSSRAVSPRHQATSASSASKKRAT